MRERPYPIRLRAEADIEDLRIAIGAAQEPVAQRPGAKGGNRHKRIRLYLDVDAEAGELESRLASGLGDADEVQQAIASVEDVARPGHTARGQGRGFSGPERRAVELRGMEFATKVLATDGWAVENVSGQRSYDLHCTRGTEVLRVEVKGTTGAGASVLLTRNEVRHANEHTDEAALFVISGIDLNRDASPPLASGGRLRRFEPWQLSGGRLEPVGYEWVLPRDESGAARSAGRAD